MGVCREVQKKRTASARLEFWPRRLRAAGHRARAKHEPQAGAASQRWQADASWPPASLPLGPSPGRPGGELLQLALSAKTQCHF